LTDEGTPKTSGFDDSGPFADTPPAEGVSLESALQQFGPAAFDDLIPRLRALAADLDTAHAAGFVHGRLHPSRIIVTEDGTYLMGRRVPASRTLTPTADQAAFAVITYEWMFGRRVSAGTTVAPEPPSGVDRGALSQALTRALSLDRERQFVSIDEFVTALERSQTLSLPLSAEEDEDPVEPFVPEKPPSDSQAAAVPVSSPPEDTPAVDVEIRPVVTANSEPEPIEPLPLGHPSPRFGGLALIAAAIVGAVLGFAAGYMARPRALQYVPPLAGAAGATSATNATSATSAAGAPSADVSAPKKEAASAAPGAGVAPAPPVSPASRIGRLLVRSTPSGASVSIDGVARGVTPLAVRDLELGSRAISVTRRGYQTEELRIVLTKARPSRSVEVRLAAPAAARPSTPASFGRPAVTTGALAIESHPSGASVSIDGKASGTTPMTINDLAPGDYRVTMTLQGFRDFATTVRVVAGGRARAAARLTEREQE
jgi:hypothetical protein